MKRLISLSVSLMALLLTTHAAYADRNALWNKVNEHCVPGYLNNDTYQPCSLVDMNEKIVIYKVDSDKYQYLLLPTDKISGIEDVKLQQDNQQNYLYDAWQARTFLTERLGQPVQERFISLAINPSNARSQDQLHIHISCLSNAANEIISNIAPGEISSDWSDKKLTIPPYSYYYRKVTLNELSSKNLFKSIADKVAQEKGSLAYTGAALVNRGPGDFILLAGAGTQTTGVSAEEIQDHGCQLAGK